MEVIFPALLSVFIDQLDSNNPTWEYDEPLSYLCYDIGYGMLYVF